MPFGLRVPTFVLVPEVSGEACSFPVRLGPNLSMRYGTVLGEYEAQVGTYGPYDADVDNGLQVARRILKYTCSTDEAGNITVASLQPGAGTLYDRTTDRIDAFYCGAFRTADLVGLDATAVSQLGRLQTGTVDDGVLRMV